MAKRTLGTFLREGNNPTYKLRRSQFVILFLSLILCFLLLNSTYQFMDLSVSNLQPLVVTIAILVGVVALSATATILMSFYRREK
ncbi:MAG TPA: hypothetical protein VNX65_04245 [Patescibacteria group bacterium]|jgi:hypothetical protein|nr:hypothetical protein [Patescibacteria group bacterium]